MYFILQDFEEYFELKFMKPPVIVKKAPEDQKAKRGLPLAPKIPSSGKKSQQSVDSKPDTTASEPSSAHTPKIVNTRGNSQTRHSAGSGLNGIRYKQISQRIEKFAAENNQN